MGESLFAGKSEESYWRDEVNQSEAMDCRLPIADWARNEVNSVSDPSCCPTFLGTVANDSEDYAAVFCDWALTGLRLRANVRAF